MAFMNKAAISASAVPEHEFFMIFAMPARDPSSLVPLALDRQWNPPALFLVSGAAKHTASECQLCGSLLDWGVWCDCQGSDQVLSWFFVCLC